jgi:hypothetical protein
LDAFVLVDEGDFDAFDIAAERIPEDEDHEEGHH